MSSNFQDLFSGHAKDYAVFRPSYPDELYPYLASLTPQQDLAWDCATGTGQSAIKLADFYQQVIATDASEKQIQNASYKQNVQYHVALADKSSLVTDSIDLITVAQALHWFDLDSFTHEVQRVLKPGGVLAVWTYNLMAINPETDKLILDLYNNTLGEHWSFDRKQVEQGYQGIDFPLPTLDSPAFSMQQSWQFEQLIGYLNTWSAVKKYQQQHNINPIEVIYEKLKTAWFDNMDNSEDRYVVNWPLTVKLWRKE